MEKNLKNCEKLANMIMGYEKVKINIFVETNAN
jgi:hypothetical protein